MKVEDQQFVLHVVAEAGKKILEIYDSEDYSVDEKEDSSPITDADRASHSLIVSALQDRFSYPILSEEDPVPYEIRKDWSVFWLLDPLDGTKDFVKRTGDFTVNLALVSAGTPVWGVIGVPSDGRIYYAEQGAGAFCKAVDAAAIPIRRQGLSDPPRCVESRFHSSEAVIQFKRTHGIEESVRCGSAIKFCAVAEGLADVYPRLAPTSEWDTAAGQIIAEEAGAEVLDMTTMKPLRYNKESTLNPHFIVKDKNFALKS